jgi:hypothetical protein
VRKRAKAVDSGYIAKKSITELIAKNKDIKLQQRQIENERLMGEEARYRQKFIDYFVRNYGDTLHNLAPGYYENFPGKVLAIKETIKFAKASPRNLLIGAGAGNFSSKLAFKASNLGVMGKYPERLVYIAPEFKENHLKLTVRYYVMSASEHSVINFPNSVYNQLLGEYGLVGVMMFVIFYLWYFIKRIRKLTYSLVLLLMLLMFFMFDYWFESFSIVVMFELMALIDLQSKTERAATAGNSATTSV